MNSLLIVLLKFIGREIDDFGLSLSQGNGPGVVVELVRVVAVRVVEEATEQLTIFQTLRVEVLEESLGNQGCHGVSGVNLHRLHL